MSQHQFEQATLLIWDGNLADPHFKEEFSFPLGGRSVEFIMKDMFPDNRSATSDPEILRHLQALLRIPECPQIAFSATEGEGPGYQIYLVFFS